MVAGNKFQENRSFSDAVNHREAERSFDKRQSMISGKNGRTHLKTTLCQSHHRSRDVIEQVPSNLSKDKLMY